MITTEQLYDIAHCLEHHGLSEETMRLLRHNHDAFHFTYCMDDDVVAAKPVLQRQAFNLYLVNSQDHCSNLTQDAARASGVVVAQVFSD